MQLTVLISIISLLLGTAAAVQLWSIETEFEEPFFKAYLRHFIGFSLLAIYGALCVYLWVNFELTWLVTRLMVSIFLLSMLPMCLSVISLADHSKPIKNIRRIRISIGLLAIPAILFCIVTGSISWFLLGLVIGAFIFFQIYFGQKYDHYKFPHQIWFGPPMFLGVVTLVLAFEVYFIWFGKLNSSYFSISLAIMYGMEAARAFLMARQFRQDKSSSTLSEQIKNLGLSQREKDVVNGVIRGLSNKQIAFELEVTENTVRNHMSRIFKKLGIRKRTELFTLLGFNSASESLGE